MQLVSMSVKSVQDVVTRIPYLKCLLCGQCWGPWEIGREGCRGAELQAPHCWGVGKWLVMILGGTQSTLCLREMVSNPPVHHVEYC